MAASPASQVSTGSFYFLRGNWIDFELALQFNTNAYTTASGQFKIATNMPTPLASGEVPGCAFSQISLVTLAAGWPMCRLQSGSNAIIAPAIMTSNAAIGNFNQTHVLASKTGVQFTGTGRYRAR